MPLGFALPLTPYVTVADRSMLEPSYLLERRFALGVGMTYQYDGSKGTTLALASMRASRNPTKAKTFRPWLTYSNLSRHHCNGPRRRSQAAGAMDQVGDFRASDLVF
jgi:uncharacterized NAD(P)/FAD-binding protein YdhS